MRRPAENGTQRALLGGMGAKRFEELRAWQLAAELRDRIVAITATPPFKTDLKFCDQLRGAACAAPRLIAEGFGRFSRREFRHYVNTARAELMEVLNDLTDLGQRGWCRSEDVEALRDLADHAIRVTTRLHSSLT